MTDIDTKSTDESAPLSLETSEKENDALVLETPAEGNGELKVNAALLGDKSNQLAVNGKTNADKDSTKLTKKNFWVRPEKSFWAKSKDGELTQAEKAWKAFLEEVAKTNNPDEAFGDFLRICCHLVQGYVEAYFIHHRLERGKSEKAYEEKRDAYINSQKEVLGREAGIREKVFEYMATSMFSDVLKETAPALWKKFKEKYKDQPDMFYIDPVTHRECINMQKMDPEDVKRACGKFGDVEQSAKRAVDNFVAGDLFNFDTKAKGTFRVGRSKIRNLFQFIGIGRETFSPKDFIGELQYFLKDIHESVPPVKQILDVQATAEAEIAAKRGFTHREFVPTGHFNPGTNINSVDVQYQEMLKELQVLTQNPTEGAIKAFTDKYQQLLKKQQQTLDRASKGKGNIQKYANAAKVHALTKKQLELAIKENMKKIEDDEHKKALLQVRNTLLQSKT